MLENDTTLSRKSQGKHANEKAIQIAATKSQRCQSDFFLKFLLGTLCLRGENESFGRVLEQTTLCKTGELSTRHDDMVIHGNPENFARFTELPGDGKILLTRLRIAARMIVDEDDARRPFLQCFRKTLARMNKRRIQRAARDSNLPHELICSGQEQRPELFVTEIAQPRKIDTGHILGCMEQRPVNAVARREPTRELERSHNARGPNPADAKRTQVRNGKPREIAQRAILREEFFRQVDGRDAPGARAKKDREELRFRQ